MSHCTTLQFKLAKLFAVLTFCLLSFKTIEKFHLYQIRIIFNDPSTKNENIYSISMESFTTLSKESYGAIRKVTIIEHVEIILYDVTRPVPKESEKIECIAMRNATPSYSLCLSATDGMSQSIRQSLSWENYVQAFIKDFFKENPTATFFDLGMNIGVHSLYAAALNPNIQVLGVEPNPQNIVIFHKAAHLNNIENRFTVIVAAVSSKRGTATASGNHSGLTITDTGDSNNGFRVNSITINDLTPFLKNKKVLLKMDIERSECHVLQNADKIFADVDISAIIMEIGGTVREGARCFESMLRFLSERNYKGFYFNGHADSFVPFHTDAHIPLNISNWKSWDFNVNVYFKKFY